MIYIVHNPKIWDNNCPGSTSDVLLTFQQYGVVLLTYDAFMHQQFNKNDSIGIFISMNDPKHRAKLKSLDCFKFVISGDEAKSDMIIFNNEIHLHDELGVSCVITAQIAKQNIDVLRKHNIDLIALSGCMNPRLITSFPDKKYDIFLSGNSTHTYPLRQRIRQALTMTKEFKILHIPFCGYEISNNKTGIYGDSFIKLASQCWLGLVDKCGAHDRLVAKYFEFGAAWCLPMGNSPSSMDVVLSNAMHQIDINLSDQEIIKSIRQVLEKKDDLQQRIITYRKHMEQHNDIELVIKRVVDKITLREYD